MDLQSKNKLKVGIVILNWNNYEDTKECLESIGHQTYESFDLVVVDGMSTDHSTERIQKEFPKYNYIYLDRDIGYGGGNNAGIKFLLKEGAEAVLSMNNDVILDKNCLEELVKELQRNSKAGIIGPRMYSYSDRKLFQLSGGYVNVLKSKPSPKWVKEDSESPIEPFEVIKLPGACILVRKEALEYSGLFDEGFFLYYADTDFEKRISDQGWRQVSVPSAKAYHKISATVGKGSLKLLYYDSRDFLYYVKKHHNLATTVYCFVKSWTEKNVHTLLAKEDKLKKLILLNMAYLHFLFGTRGKGL